jgi:CDP-glucose 4,6-dehydratase
MTYGSVRRLPGKSGKIVDVMKKFWKNKIVLITGYEGFLGSWLTKTLFGYGAKIVGIDIVKNRPISILKDLKINITGIKGDITNLKSLEQIIDRYKPRVIFHLAAEAIVEKAYRNPVRAFKSNIQGTWNILEAARGKDFIEGIIVSSSDKAYGSHKELPHKEDASLKGRHPYDVSKSCADLLSHAYYHTYGLSVCVTRCGNVYGPGDSNFSRIVPDTLRSILQNKTLIIRSDGKFIRDYIYVEDIVKGYMLLAEKMQKMRLAGEAFNFSNEKPVPVLELVRIIYKTCGKEPDYKILNQAKYEIKEQYLCAQKARKILGWVPRYSLEKGLKKTISWYKVYFQKR